MHYLVKIYRYDGDYSAEVPDLPGCVAVARTVEKTRKLITEAIGLHLELMRQAGEEVALPAQQMEFVIDLANGEEYCTWVEVEAPQEDAGAGSLSAEEAGTTATPANKP